MKPIRLVSTVGVLGVFIACGRGGGGDAPEAALPACEPVDGILPHAFDVAGLEGNYALRLYATRGDSAGKDASGQLMLMAHADSLRERTAQSGLRSTTIVTPLYGTAAINLGAVGAVTQGDLASTDPMKPGVVVIERHVDLGVEITLRFGSILNARGQTSFDGAYAALSAAWGGSNRFGGSWGSGLMESSTAGYFCADRIGESE